ncbi:hypothetical protein [Streptomyces alkaliphilus]|uniref:hypothetical protein n=1 Tax=Streptomyces alkaliphilus TaxID=1472722 RepID=UPI00117E0D8B|nr:hypothetical protein [Streptomyces alkaliphilus]MQS06140.1 hypothetical protein [Streptomyces alkaliphilus]
MFWPMLHVVLAFGGVAVLGVFAVRVGLEVNRFSRTVAGSAERIGRATEELERVTGPTLRKGAEWSAEHRAGDASR